MSTLLMTSPAHGLQDLIFDDLRFRQQRIAEIIEMIHVSFAVVRCHIIAYDILC